MKNLTILIIAFLFQATTIFAQSSKTFNVDAFNAISMSNSADIVFTQGDYNVEVSGPQELIDRLELKVKNKSLDISSKKGSWGGWNKEGGLTFKISAPNLKAVAISGSGDFTISGPFKADSFSVTIGGSGDFSANDNIFLGVSNMVISGNGDIELNGTCQKLTVVNSGNGDFEADKLVVKTASIVNSGNGDTEIHVTEKLTVVNSGNGDVEIKGNPEKKSIVNTGHGDIDYR